MYVDATVRTVYHHGNDAGRCSVCYTFRDRQHRPDKQRVERIWYKHSFNTAPCVLVSRTKLIESNRPRRINWILHKSNKEAYHQCGVADGGRCVAPTAWPRRVARLQSSAGELLESRRIWSIHRARGLPVRRLHFGPPTGRPSDKSINNNNKLLLEIWSTFATCYNDSHS